VHRVDPSYYIDFRSKAQGTGSPTAALAVLRALTANRGHANPVTIAQLGLGACQLGEGWRDVVAASAGWLSEHLESDGQLLYLFPMPHTYRLEPPWTSAMAQGQAASLFVRAASALDEPSLTDAAVRATSSLLQADDRVVVSTPDGPVLQEYPTDPPAHVLNGWIFGLWGLYDTALALRLAGGDAAAHEEAFAAGIASLVRWLPRYALAFHWSRYDLFPHPLVNIASPAYHRLHVEQLRVTASLARDDAIARVADDWAFGVDSVASRGVALARKVAFRSLRPRSQVGRRLTGWSTSA
jgi:hypothetical protein